jgi:hypothetical protein
MKDAIAALFVGFILGIVFTPQPRYIIRSNDKTVQLLIERRNFNFEICFKHPREEIRQQEHYWSVFNELDVILHTLTEEEK